MSSSGAAMRALARGLLLALVLAGSAQAQGPDPTPLPVETYVKPDTSRPPFYWNWRPQYQIPTPGIKTGIQPGHEIPPGDEVRPGVSPRCRTFWASVHPEFVTSRSTAAHWWPEWAAFYEACDVAQQRRTQP